MRMGNPSLRRWVAKSSKGDLDAEIKTATYAGVYVKSALFALVTIIAAIAVELIMLNALQSDEVEKALVTAGIATSVFAVALLVISLVVTFAPLTTKYLGFVYATLQGGLLGCAALFVDLFYPGIAFAAFLGTAIVFVLSVALNRLMQLRIGSKFLRCITIAFVSLGVIQLVMWILSMFGVFNYIAYIWVQLAVSLVCVIWATVMINWDLQNIDYLVKNGADKKYEWCVAFSLVTTLVYMYVEILELLLRIVMLLGVKKNK